MGLTLTPPDFAAVARRPWAVALGIVAHYVIMPGAGWLALFLAGSFAGTSLGLVAAGGIVFLAVVLHNISGAIVAAWLARRPLGDANG